MVEVTNMNLKTSVLMVLLSVLSIAPACNRRTASVEDHVKDALVQADYKDVTVSEDRDKNLITLGGQVHSEAAKSQAEQIAKSAAEARVVANEISVEPVGVESQARGVEHNVDAGIEKNYKAALISNGLDKQHISFDAKNGVLTLKGSVATMEQKNEAEKVGASIPNVQQVVNELQVKNRRG